jgi:hypothetical protein
MARGYYLVHQSPGGIGRFVEACPFFREAFVGRPYSPTGLATDVTTQTVGEYAHPT